MEIIQLGDKILRHISEEIPVSRIKEKETAALIKKMSGVLRKEAQGVGLAAVQIGIPKSIFIVSKYVFKKNELGAENKEELKKRKEKEEYEVFINPKIVKLSKKKVLLSEGCLSIAGKFGKVRRSANATVEAYDENGVKFRRGAGGLLAQVIQHEVDHLGGVLFVDKIEK